MKRLAVLIAALLLVATLCYAEGLRNPEYSYEGNTGFGSITVSGLNTSGNPGYIAIVGAATGGTAPVTYYLWVDDDGTLRIASDTTMELNNTAASFPTGDWSNMKDAVGTVVGAQTE